jgi:hypothetical protein
LGASSLIFIQWVFGPYTQDLQVQTLVYLTVIFLIYFITSLLNFVYRDRNYKGIDGILLYSIPIVYFLLSLTLLDTRDEISLLSLIIGIFYIVFSLVIRTGMGEIGELKKFSNALLCIASPFIALSTALHFEGSTVTLLWAVEAMVMVLIGYIIDTPSNRILGIILSMFAFFRMIFNDLNLSFPADPIFNERSATIFFVLLSYAVIWKLYNSQIKGREDEMTVGSDPIYLAYSRDQ